MPFAALTVLALLQANPYLIEGKKLYASVKFDKAIEQLEAAAQVPTNDLDEKREIFDLLGRCYIAAGRRDKAEEAFTAWMTIDPHAEIDRSLSPKILEAFDAAKSRLFPPDYVALSWVPSPPGLLRLSLVDPWRQATEVTLHLKQAGAPVWSESKLEQHGGAYVADLSSYAAVDLHWYAEARDANGRAVAKLGSAEDPLRLLAPASPTTATKEAPPPQSRQRTKAWVTAGLAAAAAVAGTVMMVLSSATEARAQSEQWADTKQALRTQAVREQRTGALLFVGAGAVGAAAVFLFTF